MNTTTKKAEFTKGPWKAEKYCVWGGRFQDVYVAGTQTAIDTETQEANARLIAAAPELLEALEYAQQIISTARRYFPKSIQNSDTFQLENANAAIGKAIRKARGGE